MTRKKCCAQIVVITAGWARDAEIYSGESWYLRPVSKLLAELWTEFGAIAIIDPGIRVES